jgi:hypothetical protein
MGIEFSPTRSVLDGKAALYFFHFKRALGVCGDFSATSSASQHVLQIATIAPAVHPPGNITRARLAPGEPSSAAYRL